MELSIGAIIFAVCMWLIGYLLGYSVGENNYRKKFMESFSGMVHKTLDTLKVNEETKQRQGDVVNSIVSEILKGEKK